MRRFVLFISLFVCAQANAQVFGEIMLDKRAVLSDFDFNIPYHQSGKLVFDIRVNVDGKVTYCQLDESQSTIIKTPAMIKARNKIMQELKFAKGIGYPKFHSGYVQMTAVKDSVKVPNAFLPPPF